MDQLTSLDFGQLQEYFNTEQAKAERAKREAIQAERDQLAADREARMAAASAADAAQKAAADPNAKAAEMIHVALGPQWPSFMSLFQRSSLVKLGDAILKLDGNLASGARHSEALASPQARVAARAAAEAEKVARGETQLAKLGIRDVTEDDE